MKLNGKKTLACILTIATILSLCSFNAFAATAPTAIAISVKQEKETIGVGESITLQITPTPSTAAKSVNWETSDSDVMGKPSSKGVAKGKAPGTVTLTATSTKSDSVTKSITITVEEIESATMEGITVGYDTSKSTVKAILNSKKVKMNYDGGYYEVALDDDQSWSCANYDADEAGTYVFKTTVDDIECSVDVTVGKITLQNDEDATLETIYIPKGTKNSSSLLPAKVSLLLNNSNEETSLSIDGTYYEAWDSEDDVPASGKKFEEVGPYTYTAEPKVKKNYDLPTLIQPVEVYETELDDYETSADLDGLYLDEAIDYISDGLEETFEAELDHISITKITGDNGKKVSNTYVSGTLYTDDDCTTEVDVDDDSYDYEDAQKLFFLPNGKGHDTIYEYIAYADEDGTKKMTGKIVISSEIYMVMNMDVNSSDVLDFSSAAFKKAFEALNDDCELDYVVFENELSSYQGELYYKYDSKKNRSVVDDEEYYVKADDGELDLDDVTFVPDEDAEGVIAIEFTAFDEDEDVETEGIIYITVTNVADIVIQSGKGETTLVDIELFEDFLDDEVDTDKIAYIVFEGAPYSATNGYLTCEGKDFKSSGDKTFHMDPDKGEYDLEKLYFMGGSSTGTKRATFEIYYYDGKTVEDDPVTGTVDFVTGVSTNVYTKAPMKASEVLKFSSSISAFEKVGDQENEYFKFTSLPKGAKLYYNYGMSTQEDVKIGTEYYLGTVSGSKKALKNITFVPSYSSVKKQQVITFEYKAYDKDGNYVSGACFFEVAYASKSDYFSDITTALYADSVDFLKNRGITTGATATTFGPNNNVTRGQFVTFLWRAAGSPDVTGVTNKFTDVKSTGDYAYAYKAILWAVKNNITTGRSATIFDPAANVTHQELLTFLYRYDVNYLKHSGAASTSVSYSDFNSVADYAKTAVKWADNKGILDGYTIQPTNAGIRATVALWLHRMLTL